MLLYVKKVIKFQLGINPNNLAEYKMNFSETTLIFALAGKYLLEKKTITSFDQFHTWLFQCETIKELENNISYHFLNKTLLAQALTHQSFIHENDYLSLKNYQRLEFLGDSIINCFISSKLFDLCLEEEGELSKIRASLVNEKYLSKISSQLNLARVTLVGKGVLQQNIYRDSLGCDVFEALIGAIYKDSNMAQCYTILETIFGKIDLDRTEFDYKSQLQEWTLQNYSQLPDYEFEENQDLSFTACLSINEQLILKATGKSKRKAEEKAAFAFLTNKTQYLQLNTMRGQLC